MYLGGAAEREEIFKRERVGEYGRAFGGMTMIKIMVMIMGGGEEEDEEEKGEKVGK